MYGLRIRRRPVVSQVLRCMLLFSLALAAVALLPRPAPAFVKNKLSYVVNTVSPPYITDADAYPEAFNWPAEVDPFSIRCLIIYYEPYDVNDFRWTGEEEEPPFGDEAVPFPQVGDPDSKVELAAEDLARFHEDLQDIRFPTLILSTKFIRQLPYGLDTDPAQPAFVAEAGLAGWVLCIGHHCYL